MNEIKMHPWWILVAKEPSLMPLVSSVMTLRMGGQPRGMQHNIGKGKCTICQTGPDKPNHVLFECKALYNKRGLLLARIVKASFLISCLQFTYVSDWQVLRDNVAKFVHTVYAERKLKHDIIIE